MKLKKRRNLIVSVLLHALLLIVAYIFQGAVFPYLRLGGLVPLIMPIVVTGIALYEGRDVGGICGLFAGMLCDISFNQPVGVFTVYLTVVGVGIGILSDTVILSGFMTYYIGCAVVLVISAFIQMTPIVATPNYIPIGSIITTASMQTLYALIAAFPIWFPIRALGRYAQRFQVVNK